jgi:1-acyl-sn-glycerol-3-phosphate acyltransferase
MRNPTLGPAAVLAEYASGDAGVDLIRDVAERVAAGRSLLVFPEGTRTLSGVKLNPLKPGFALIASRAHVPVRLLVVRGPRDLIPKGWPWWRIPDFPAHVEITLLGELDAAGAANATELTARATRQLSAALAAS